jgi:hypothetical protein
MRAGVVITGNEVFTRILPRILTGEKITRKDIAVLGHGGFRLH